MTKINLKVMKKKMMMIGLALMMAGCSAPSDSIVENNEVYLPEVKLISVQPGLQQDFKVTGDVTAYRSTQITAQQRSKVKKIYFKEGASVEKDQIIIELSSSDISTQVSNAQRNYSSAQVQLSSTKLSGKEGVRVAEASLKSAKTSLENIQIQNGASRHQAKQNLEAAKVKLELGISSAQTDLDNTMESIKPIVQTAFNTINKIIGATEVYEFIEDDFRKSIGVAKVNSFNEAKKSILNLRDRLEQTINDTNEALLILWSAEEAVEKTLVALNNSTTGSRYTEAQLIADIAAVTPQLNAVQNQINLVKIKKAALDSAKQENEGGSQALLQAEATYKNTMAQLESAERNAKRAVESAIANLENAKRSAELSEAGAKSNLSSIQGQLKQASVNKEKLFIKAPFNGKIREIAVKDGEEVNLNQLMVIFEDDSLLKITTYLSSVDVQKIAVGEMVQLGKGGESAMIHSISSSADPVTRKYKVELNHKSNEVRAGTSVDIIFSSNKSELSSKLYVPLTSLHIFPEEVFVWMIEDEKSKKRAIQVGEVIGNYAEVISGIAAGDLIVGSGSRLIEEEGIPLKIVK